MPFVGVSLSEHRRPNIYGVRSLITSSMASRYRSSGLVQDLKALGKAQKDPPIKSRQHPLQGILIIRKQFNHNQLQLTISHCYTKSIVCTSFQMKRNKTVEETSTTLFSQ